LSNIQTVLVKSTDDAVTKVVSKALSELDGYRLIYCDDDNSALNRLDDIKVDLIIYDLNLRDFGPENALVRSRLSHTACSRIVVCNSEERSEGARVCEDSASYLFLMKPLDEKQIRISVKRALEQTEL